jgi:hypothetical protein
LHFPAWAEEDHENPEDRRWPCQDPNLSRPEYESTALCNRFVASTGRMSAYATTCSSVMLLFLCSQMAVIMARYMECLESLQGRSSHIRRLLFQDLRYAVFGFIWHIIYRGESEWPVVGRRRVETEETRQSKLRYFFFYRDHIVITRHLPNFAFS